MAKPKELYVGINELSFCLYDADSNEAVLNKDGTVKEYNLTYKASKGLDWFVEGLEPTDLEEMNDDNTRTN